jgi:molybdopterin/thiamine biosynthesis adenylyltransferase
LPGIGQIDIWDDKVVTDNDLSQSFFYAVEDIGRPRAESAVEHLLEMNPDVKGEAFVLPPNELL